MKRWIVGAAATLASVLAGTSQVQNWPGDYAGRLTVYALTERLDSDLLASRSATRTLEAWCARHRMADPARLVATPAAGAVNPATGEIRAALDVGPDEPLRYRRVALSCGGHVLSEAENWYVPARLTAAMNRTLDTTDTPFGRVVGPLAPSRQTLSVERLWSPLPPDWDSKPEPPPAGDQGALAIPAFLFRHRAVVYDGAHRPIAYVIESYTGELLDFPH